MTDPMRSVEDDAFVSPAPEPVLPGTPDEPPLADGRAPFPGLTGTGPTRPAAGAAE